MDSISSIQRFIAILWPSFLTAGVATVLSTVVFDPAIIFIDYDITRLSIYTISFFLFWFLGAVSSAATSYFLKPSKAVNK